MEETNSAEKPIILSAKDLRLLPTINAMKQIYGYIVSQAMEGYSIAYFTIMKEHNVEYILKELSTFFPDVSFEETGKNKQGHFIYRVSWSDNTIDLVYV